MDGWKRPGAYIQWKGTDVWLDFHCPCGVDSHVDDDSVYGVQCPACGRVFTMPTEVELDEGDPDEGDPDGCGVVTARL